MVMSRRASLSVSGCSELATSRMLGCMGMSSAVMSYVVGSRYTSRPPKLRMRADVSTRSTWGEKKGEGGGERGGRRREGSVPVACSLRQPPSSPGQGLTNTCSTGYGCVAGMWVCRSLSTIVAARRPGRCPLLRAPARIPYGGSHTTASYMGSSGRKVESYL